MTSKRIGIVIPTIFERPEYLFDAISSIRSAGDAFILLCAPDGDKRLSKYENLIDGFLPELSTGNLARKIDYALKSLPEECEYIGWLGDDDLLTSGALTRASVALDENLRIGLVYGSCDYIDAEGQIIGGNPSGSWAKKLLRFGPFLIPQPASLWRRSAYLKIGGINADYNLAFDYDLFLRLIRSFSAEHLKVTQAQFRWHLGSLSVGSRWSSVLEASKVRRANYGVFRIPLSVLWEPIVILATKIAGDVVTWRTLRNQGSPGFPRIR